MTETLTQLELDFDGRSQSKARAWLIAAQPDEAPRIIAWLTTPPGVGSRAFFVRAGTGEIAIGANEPIFLITRSSRFVTAILPRNLVETSARQLWSDVVANGAPVGLDGGMASDQRLVLVRTWGGLMQASPRRNGRGLVPTLEKAASRNFRSNPVVMRRLCETALNQPKLSISLVAIFQRLLAEALVELSPTLPSEEREQVIRSCWASARAYQALGLGDIARRMTRAVPGSSPGAAIQLDLFGAPDTRTVHHFPRVGLATIQCQALPIEFTTEQKFRTYDVPNTYRLDMMADDRLKLSRKKLRAWLLETKRSAIVPYARINGTVGTGLTRIDVCLASEFEACLDEVVANRAGDAAGLRWRIIPLLGERGFLPQIAYVRAGERAHFSVNTRSRGQARKPVVLSILTPDSRAATIEVGLKI